MGDLAFGKSFDMLKKGEHHWAIKIMLESVKPVGVLAHAPWLMNMLKPIPFMQGEVKRFEKFSEDAVEERKKIEPAEPDVMSHILAAEPIYSDPKLESLLLTGDSKLVIIAGSDTTSTTLAFAFYHPAKDPSEVAKLRDELSTMPDFSVHALQGFKYLNGFVMETLRLHPPVPGGVFRTTPPEGLQVGDHYIPGNTQILTPTWSLHRCKYILLLSPFTSILSIYSLHSLANTTNHKPYLS
jgi:cytochrome P450